MRTSDDGKVTISGEVAYIPGQSSQRIHFLVELMAAGLCLRNWNDGLVQFQTHFEDNELRLCHTSCKILDAGLLVDLLRRLRVWLENHPNEVVSVLMGNDNFIDVGNYTASIVNSGLIDYVYHPPAANLDLDAWPTLGDMI
ncbi:uncharacterized protein PV06_11598 [Exophiala oligosperma]|uniref:Uncharacterized protein n=1 Tax=Exophiala oligosperma TaxID=215243 RepID=A0A0D2DK48_9EURO|nr:uncharacterized protein PV06_11598 [Exophiala oligosperma]KIW36084.1 hypothetical protein PV06_11598 [Exophiala oligosperma]